MYKVVFWGRFGVGKSSIAALLETGDFASYNPYVVRSGFPTATLTLEDGTQVKLELWDTAGQERYHQILSLGQFRCTDVFLIVYSPADVESFQIAKQTLESTTQNTKTNPFCQYLLICSHRAKQKAQTEHSEQKWEISSKEGSELALAYDAFYLELDVADVGAFTLLSNKLREVIHKKRLSSL